MASNFVKSETVVRQALGLLERELTLPSIVWRDAGGSFVGARGDTITLRVPAYLTARERVLRGGRPITVDELSETSVPLTLDKDVYKAVKITDEEMTLDIVSFGEQVTRPVVNSVARGVEDAVAAEMSGASYYKTVELPADPYIGLLEARKYLNMANVPFEGRYLVLGANIEEDILASDHLSKFDQSGSDTAFRDAVIGKIAGFTALTSPGLDPDMGVAFHRTAFALGMQAPIVPEGATWGRSMSVNGLAMRVLRDYDFLNVQDRLLADVFIGTGTISDAGYFDSKGRFQPFTEELGPEITLATSAAADDIIDTGAAHGFEEDDAVVFSELTGGTGLTAGQVYYVTGDSLAAQTFRVSATLGGSSIDFSSNITAGKVRAGGHGQLVRAVKIVNAS